MPKNAVWLLHLCILRWNPAKPTLEEIIPQINCFVTLRYYLALFHLEKIAPDLAENGIPAETVLSVLQPNYPELNLEFVINVLKSTEYVIPRGNGFLLNRPKLQEKMFDCHVCHRQVTFGQEGCPNTDCPTNKGAKA
ncbi:MAG: hypothetical protein WC528_03695 [Patescibacteria group bacterium]